MKFDSKFYSNKVSAEEIITSHIVKEINKRFKNIESLEDFQNAFDYLIIPYKVKDPVNTLVDIVNQNKFTKTRLYEEFSSVSKYNNGILVFQFLRRELYCLVPFSDAYLDGTSIVICFGREACLMRFKDFLYYISGLYEETTEN